MNQQSKTIVSAFLSLVTQLALGAVCSAQQENSSSNGSDRTVGVVKVDSITCSAAVKDIDYAKRSITLHTPSGADRTFTVGKEVVNFDQIKPGDMVKATFAEALGVYVRKPGAPADSGARTTVALAPKGAMPGAMMADTVEVTAKVVDIDQETRMATLQGEDGATHTIHVGPNINLASVSKGDQVVFRYTRGLVLRVDRTAGSESEQLASSRQRGGVIVEATTTEATVTAIDKDQRAVTLTRPDGSKRTIKVARSVDLDQLNVGDEVKVTLAEALGISLHKPDAQVTEREPDTVALATGDGSAIMAASRQETAKIEAIDTETRTVTLQASDGKARIVHVGPRVDLTGVAPGDQVVLRYTEAVAVKIEK